MRPTTTNPTSTSGPARPASLAAAAIRPVGRAVPAPRRLAAAAPPGARPPHIAALASTGLVSAALAAAVLTGVPAAARAADGDVAVLFERTCAGCHAGGGNVVQPGATLAQADLERNGAASPEAVYQLIYGGKGRMPGYGEGCTPRGQCTFAARLPDADVQRLADYVLAQAKAGW